MAKSKSGAVFTTGFKDLDRKLARLEPALQRRWVRKAMRAGLKVIQRAAQANVHSVSGTLSRNIKVRASKNRRRGVISLELRVGNVDWTAPRWYPAHVEFGNHTKGTAAHPFMKPAYASHGPAARDVALHILAEGVKAELRRG